MDSRADTGVHRPQGDIQSPRHIPRADVISLLLLGTGPVGASALRGRGATTAADALLGPPILQIQLAVRQSELALAIREAELPGTTRLQPVDRYLGESSILSVLGPVAFGLTASDILRAAAWLFKLRYRYAKTWVLLLGSAKGDSATAAEFKTKADEFDGSMREVIEFIRVVGRKTGLFGYPGGDPKSTLDRFTSQLRQCKQSVLDVIKAIHGEARTALWRQHSVAAAGTSGAEREQIYEERDAELADLRIAAEAAERAVNN